MAEASPTDKVGKLVYPGQDGDEVILEGSYCAFRSVASMHVRGDKLEFGSPCEGNCLFERSASFVVHDLEVHR